MKGKLWGIGVLALVVLFLSGRLPSLPLHPGDLA